MSDHLYIASLMQCMDVRSNYMTLWLIMAFVRSFLQTYNHLCDVGSEETFFTALLFYSGKNPCH